jgi:hypothetical protein
MWIAAVGKIAPGTAERLRQVIQSPAGRRLPILINSPGGLVTEAITMGRLIHRSGLGVAVADTSLAECRSAGKSSELRASTSLKAICDDSTDLHAHPAAVRDLLSHRWEPETGDFAATRQRKEFDQFDRL